MPGRGYGRSLAQSGRDHAVYGLQLLFHDDRVLGLHVAGVDGLHGLAQQGGVLQADHLDQLGLLAGAALDHHLVHSRRHGDGLQLVAVLHLFGEKR